MGNQSDRHIRWKGVDSGSLEELHLRETDDGVQVDSTVTEKNSVWRYQVSLDANWTFQSLTIENGLELIRDENGWKKNGVPAPELSECIDIDLSISPFTNTLPIRSFGRAHTREQPRQGASPSLAGPIRRLTGSVHEIAVAWVGFPELTVHLERQRYTRLDARHWRFESLDGTFTRDIEVDETGLVIHYPGLFERVD